MDIINTIRANCPDLARRAASVAALPQGDLQTQQLDRLIGLALSEPNLDWTLDELAALVAACTNRRHLPLWYSVADVVQQHGIPRRTLHNALEAGEVPGAYRLPLDTSSDTRVEWRIPPQAVSAIPRRAAGRPHGSRSRV